jgi:hypothetical protein
MLKIVMTFLRPVLVLALLAVASVSLRADNILFIGNSFTFADMAPLVKLNGGVPALVKAIAMAKGRQVETTAVTAGGKDWSYHLAQPKTAKALEKTWDWVVLQDFSTRPTKAGSIDQFMKDGETFSDRIAAKSPKAGIILYETWARPPGAYFEKGEGKVLGSPEEMMSELHQSYAKLHDDLAARNPAREVRVALVGTAFARCKAEFPAIQLDASDAHHATAEGYYLAALVIYETIYHDSSKGAPTEFFHDLVKFPADVATELQGVADEVSAAPAVK